MSGLRPKFGCQSQGFIREWKVAPWSGADESVKPTDAESLLRPQQFSFELIVNNGWNDDAGSAVQTTREPVGDGDNLGAALRMGQETKWARIEEEKPRAHGYQ